ncbi:MAG: hypothetical protein LUF92_06360 [Clostridiales bacterium]|nr:hypothetical protein [Clostridiales bacterium]
MRKYKKILVLAMVLLFSTASENMPTIQAEAKAVTTVRKKQNISMKKLTAALKKKIAATTPDEKSGSDLKLIYPATRLSTARLPQGYTSDGTYYYYLSGLANVGTHKNDLRLTRIKYKGIGKYSTSYMTLKEFGHGTNLDCVTVDGTTWLWTGSDTYGSKTQSSSISCFTFQAGRTLKRHASISYRIPISGTKTKYASNCYPAVSADGSQLIVRFTNNGGQQFQFYDLKNGTTIKPKKCKKTVRLKSTAGVFQGFDVSGTTIYTIEGSAEKSEMRELGKLSSYSPIRVRTYNYKTGKSKVQKITGASGLSHREPEGIHVSTDGMVEIMIASHYKELYTCVNIYEVLK